MSTTVLLLLAVAAIAVLLALVIRAKMSAFVAMILVSMVLALAARIPIGDVVQTMIDGMGKTLGSVAIVVGLGAMLGRVIEAAGGAEVLAERFTRLLGRERVVAAVVAAAFILGIPIFFDVGFIILAPIVFGFASIAKINPLKIGLPVAATMLALHVVIPPHPGPVASAATLGVDVGLLTMLSLPVCALVAVVVYFASKRLHLERVAVGQTPFGGGASESTGSADVSSGQVTRARTGPGTVVFLILEPIAQIMFGTVGQMLVDESSMAYTVLGFVGSSTTALLTAVMLAYFIVGHQQRWSLERRGTILDSALPDVATIVFVTGAGGVFAGVLVASGIGDALAQALVATHMPILLTAFVISAALRASQGSATVAILTTAGLLADAIAGGGYSALQVVLIQMAIGFGSLGFSHINDSGFWIVTKYLGLSVKDGLKKWTVLSTIAGLTGFLLTGAVWLVA
ncbi:GntP family transporter [Propionibacterium australiense]|uniref:GntP family transporter n=1 Tax=Propionibacterium australiense TaxID=119981 RepID=A0A383S4U8_9ACTN|nr:GntP family transporter [Propionibacterium australiense]RLP11580.1 GntP family transporter [Propionibacterium australiense]RLP12686.1 GntP family transporter [Propionibacterium australiense]SYZ32296.1 gntP: transporter, gluconate:H+ symporter (GntP) family [Propionibacterium australiense]VEH90494.1 Inner membrane permease ygbN [Propionibacterium australiense]